MGTQPDPVTESGRSTRPTDPAYREPGVDPVVGSERPVATEPVDDPYAPGGRPTGSTDQSPEEIRREIEETRRRMSETVDDIEDRVSPGRVAQRQKAKARSRWQSVKESVMGTVDDAKSSVMGTVDDAKSSVMGTVDDAKSSVGSSGSSSGGGAAEQVRQAPDAVKQQARGNPLAAGLIAFGAGALVASLFPATEREQEAADKLQDEYGDTVKEKGKEVAQDVAGGVQSDAKDAAMEVAKTAAGAASNVKDEGQSHAQEMRDQQSS